MDDFGHKALPLVAGGLAAISIAAAVLTAPPAIAAPAPLAPGQGPSPNPNPAPATPKRHLWCMVTGGAGHGISYSKVCWYRTY